MSQMEMATGIIRPIAEPDEDAAIRLYTYLNGQSPINNQSLPLKRDTETYLDYLVDNQILLFVKDQWYEVLGATVITEDEDKFEITKRYDGYIRFNGLYPNNATDWYNELLEKLVGIQ